MRKSRSIFLHSRYLQLGKSESYMLYKVNLQSVKKNNKAMKNSSFILHFFTKSLKLRVMVDLGILGGRQLGKTHSMGKNANN